MTDNRMIAALVQHACNDDYASNLRAGIQGIKAAAEQGASLVLLQELHTSLYFCQTEASEHFDLAETIPGATTDSLGALAASLGLVIVTSLFEKRATGVYHNTAVVLDSDGSIAGCYRKMHIPDDPGYQEKYYFSPGDLGFVPIRTAVGNLGVMVCWDQWFPEAARMMALAGADVLLYPAAIGWDERDSEAEQARQRDAWLTIQRGHAIANCLPVLTCNRTGHEKDPSGQTGGIRFWGSSSAIGPQGELLAQAGSAAGEVLVTALDFERTRELRRAWPFLRDRRIDAYRDLLKRYRD